MKRFACFFYLMNLFTFHHSHAQTADKKPIVLNVLEREITVNDKKSKVYGLIQEDGTFGIVAHKGDAFNVTVENNLDVPTSIHWHGLILPNGQDGVAFITQFPIYPKTQYQYDFPLLQAGTFFMHAHYGLQEQRLLSAPLILLEPEDDPLSDQDVIVMLTDFSFKSPSQIYAELRCKKMKSGMRINTSDVVEVDYDAFLANFKTLENPEVYQVKKGDKVRLRLINASSATNFFINLDTLEGELIAVDGNRVRPIKGKEFELGVAQRVDVVLTIPAKGGYFPIYAIGEGTKMQTGIVLSTGSEYQKLHSMLAENAGAMTNQQESMLEALHPLPTKQVNQSIVIELGGDMENYIWTLNKQAWPESTPVVVKKGDRVELTFKNVSTMTHPMHLHGHVFQVTAMDGKKMQGAIRDTVLVTPNSSVTVQFDANNPGVWPLHCHVLYHLEAGMLTVVRYEDFIQPLLK